MTDQERYLAAAHAMQSGVAMKMHHDPAETSPKHLRVGLNSCQVNDAALARLLIEKGIITEAEYRAAVADEMERERERYADYLSKLFGTKVTLV